MAIHSEKLFSRYAEEEINFVESLAKLYNQSYMSINFGEDVIKDMIMSSISGRPISVKSATMAYRLMIQRVALVANVLEDFILFPQDVQKSLLKHNADMVVSLRGADFFHASKQGSDQLLCSLGINDLETAIDLVEEVKISFKRDEQDFKPIEYKNFNSIQEKLDNTEGEKRYDLLLSRVGANVSLDENLLILLTFVIILCSDFDDGKVNPASLKSIEKAQSRMIGVLQRYISAKFVEEEGSSILNSTMQCLGDLRELCIIKDQRRKEPLRKVTFTDSSYDAVPVSSFPSSV